MGVTTEVTVIKMIENSLHATYSLLKAHPDKFGPHIEGLENRKGRGSYVEGVNDKTTLLKFFVDVCAYGTAHVVSNQKVEEMFPGSSKDGCTYIRFNIPSSYTAREGVMRMSELLNSVKPGEDLNVTVRRSLHDSMDKPMIEFVMNSPEEDCPTVDEGWLILGPGDNEGKSTIIWTWHPGGLTSAPSDTITSVVQDLVVKLNA